MTSTNLFAIELHEMLRRSAWYRVLRSSPLPASAARLRLRERIVRAEGAD